MAGSIRRQRPLIGDIEIVALPHPAVDLLGDTVPNVPTALDHFLAKHVTFSKNGRKFKQFKLPLDTCYITWYYYYMDEITLTTSEIINLIESGTKNLYVRWSDGPEVDRNGTSRDWAAGQSHAEGTLSANALIRHEEKTEFDEFGYWLGTMWVEDLDFCQAYGLQKWVEMQLSEYRFLPGRPWVMIAERVGTDSDNAPLVDSRTFEFVGYWAGK